MHTVPGTLHVPVHVPAPPLLYFLPSFSFLLMAVRYESIYSWTKLLPHARFLNVESDSSVPLWYERRNNININYSKNNKYKNNNLPYGYPMLVIIYALLV